MIGGDELPTLEAPRVRLRWLAVFGQSLAVLGVHFILDFPLPLGACLGVIALSAWLNIFLTLRWR